MFHHQPDAKAHPASKTANPAVFFRPQESEKFETASDRRSSFTSFADRLAKNERLVHAPRATIAGLSRPADKPSAATQIWARTQPLISAVGKVVRVDASRWKKHKGKDACSEKGSPTPADATGRASTRSPAKHGLLAAQLLPDGRLQLMVEGHFLTDPVAAMAAAIQLADYARSLHERTKKIT